jgi:hypothetical protein
MQQANPAEDWAIQSRTQNTQALKSSLKGSARIRAKAKVFRNPSPLGDLAHTLFIHHNILKLDARYLLDKLESWRNEKGQVMRLWGDRNSVIASFGYDIERVLWEELAIAACYVDNATCEKMRAHFADTFSDSDSRGG